jgi:hypothetical protein
MSYRLNKADERDVRWGLSQDVKGDMGMCSAFDGFERAMNLRAKIDRYDPPQPRRDRDGGLILKDFTEQYIPVKDPRPTFTTYELDDRFLDAARRVDVIYGAFQDIGPAHLRVLDRCYYDRRPEGLEPFGELAGLSTETHAARYGCHPREIERLNGYDPGILDAVIALSARVRSSQTIDDDQAVKMDEKVFEAIKAEADALLSAASSAYVHASSKRRRAKMIADAARAARRADQPYGYVVRIYDDEGMRNAA